MARSPVRVPLLLLCALLHLNLLRTATALITISEIKGTYILLERNLNVCEGTMEISSNGSPLAAQNLSFGGKACRLGSFPLAERGVYDAGNDITNQKVGIHVIGTSSELLCQQIEMFNVTLLFIRPVADIKLRGRGFKDFYTFRKGMQYSALTGGSGSCHYQLASSGPSPTPASSKPNKGSSVTDGTDAKEKEKGSGLNMWVWLGPIIGAVATVIGSIITVVRCSRRDANNNPTVGAITINNKKP